MCRLDNFNPLCARSQCSLSAKRETGYDSIFLKVTTYRDNLNNMCIAERKKEENDYRVISNFFRNQYVI